MAEVDDNPGQPIFTSTPIASASTIESHLEAENSAEAVAEDANGEALQEVGEPVFTSTPVSSASRIETHFEAEDHTDAVAEHLQYTEFGRFDETPGKPIFSSTLNRSASNITPLLEVENNNEVAAELVNAEKFEEVKKPIFPSTPTPSAPNNKLLPEVENHNEIVADDIKVERFENDDETTGKVISPSTPHLSASNNTSLSEAEDHNEVVAERIKVDKVEKDYENSKKLIFTSTSIPSSPNNTSLSEAEDHNEVVTERIKVAKVEKNDINFGKPIVPSASIPSAPNYISLPEVENHNEVVAEQIRVEQVENDVEISRTPIFPLEPATSAASYKSLREAENHKEAENIKVEMFEKVDDNSAKAIFPSTPIPLAPKKKSLPKSEYHNKNEAEHAKIPMYKMADKKPERTTFPWNPSTSNVESLSESQHNSEKDAIQDFGQSPKSEPIDRGVTINLGEAFSRIAKESAEKMETPQNIQSHNVLRELDNARTDAKKQRSSLLPLSVNETSSIEFIGDVTESKGEAHFIDGSRYQGTWDALGMAGVGTYTMPHGVVFKGEIRDGMQHGHGTLEWPRKQRIDGVWKHGKLQDVKLCRANIWEDELMYKELNWKYCQFPDRRFQECLKHGLRAARKSLKTNKQPTTIIPPDCYYTGDGIFDPKKFCVFSFDHPAKVLRVPTKEEYDWIVKKCRKGVSQPTGYQPWLNENWSEINPPDLPYRLPFSEDSPEHWWKRLSTFKRDIPEVNTAPVSESSEISHVEHRPATCLCCGETGMLGEVCYCIHLPGLSDPENADEEEEENNETEMEYLREVTCEEMDFPEQEVEDAQEYRGTVCVPPGFRVKKSSSSLGVKKLFVAQNEEELEVTNEWEVDEEEEREEEERVGKD